MSVNTYPAKASETAQRGTLAARVHYTVQLLFRYYIAYQMFSYASAKLLGTQFTVGPSTLDRPIGDLSGFELTWAYYGYSHTYGAFIAFAQIAAGVFLIFRPTVRLGLLLFLTVIGNIVMIDFFYNIDGAKSAAVTLLLMGLYLFVSDWRAFWSYAFGTPYVREAAVPGFIRQRKWTTWARAAAVPVLFAGAFGTIYLLKQNFMASTPLDGAWAFSGDSGAWSRLYFEQGGYCAIRAADGAIINDVYQCDVNTQEGTVAIDVKRIDWESSEAAALMAEADEATSFEEAEAVYERLLAGSPSMFSFNGRYQVEGDALRLEPEGGAPPLELTKVTWLYGRPYATSF